MADPIAPLLDLDTQTRARVVIDQRAYALFTSDDFTIIEYQRHIRETQRLSTLLLQQTLTEEEGVELEAVLDGVCRRVLDAPAEVHARLPPGHRLAIITAFSQLPSTRRQLTGATTPATDHRPMDAPATEVIAGSISSPASNGSMAAIP